MWSLGVILYTFVYGNMPFSGDKFDEIKKNITLGQFSEPEFYSGAHNLITRLLNPRASKRLTLLQACRHSWINNDSFYENVLKLFQDCKTESTTISTDCLCPDLDDFLELERRVEEESKSQIGEEEEKEDENKLNLIELKKSVDEISKEIEDEKDESAELEDEGGDEYTYDDMMKELLSIDEPEPEPELENEIKKPLTKTSASLTESQCEHELRNLFKMLTKPKEETNEYESKFNNVFENETEFILKLCDSSRTSES